MKVSCDWNKKQNFVAEINGFKVHMDATVPFGDASAPTPKQLVLASLCGCTGMDVIGLLKKNKLTPEKFKILAESESTKSHPHELTAIKLQYIVEGPCKADLLIEIIGLSQSKYCSVSATLSRVAPISYEIILNGTKIFNGISDFKTNDSLKDVAVG